MAISKQKNFDSLKLIAPIILVLYLCIGFIPNWDAVDRIAPQWVVMSFVNIFSVFIILINKGTLSHTISKILGSKISLVYLIFIIWAMLSYFYAINPTEVLVNVARQVNVLFMFFAMTIFFFSINKRIRFISWLILIVLNVELYFLLNEAFQMIELSGLIEPGALKGVTANRNIAAFSIAIKIPFIFLLLFQVKKMYLKVYMGLIIFLSVFSLTMIQSRASFVAIGLIIFLLVIFLVYLFFNSKEEKRKLKNVIYLFGIFILFPIVLAIYSNKLFVSNKGADAISRAATISLNTNDGSVNQRLRYYEDVFIHLISNPIFGVGLGNWKLKSIDYDSKDIKGYVVPYHAHSDFIQLGAELGVFGFLFYLGIFLILIYYMLRLFLSKTQSLEEKTFIFILFLALSVYLVDANLNFPIARPQLLILWATTISLTTVYYLTLKKPKPKGNFSNIFLSISFIFLIPTLFINYKVYQSQKGQMYLLQDFNSNQFNLPLSQVDNVVPEIPNITVTTIPINSVKARYFVNAKKYDKALKLLEKGTGANPFLYYSEILKSQIFSQKGELDSAKIYAKKAFFGLPNNDLHSTTYIRLINITRDREALEEAFPLLTYKNKFNNWKNYLVTASTLYPSGDKKLSEKAKQALDIFPENQDIKALYGQIAIGPEGIMKAQNFTREGLEFYNKGDFKRAAQAFEKAIEINSLDYTNFENAATSNYLIGNLQKALDQINTVINKLNPMNGKCEYIKATIFIRMGDPIGACPLLATARDSGYLEANNAFDQYCK